MLLSCMTFTACDNGDDLDTNQYKAGVNLNVFGPCPVARGGQLRFLGSGMDQITAVVIPGSGEITDIQVISENEIQITVPQDAEVGLITLKSEKGEITTMTEITYSEPISIDDVTSPVKPGEVLTIQGEYLNLIKEVIFAEKKAVTTFVSQSRKEIKVVVPMDAQSGELTLADAIEGESDMRNLIVWDDLDVVLPSVQAITDLSAAKPGDEVAISGKDFDLVVSMKMPNGDDLPFDYVDGKLMFVLPANASNGAIVAIPASGVEVVVATIGMALPTEVVATPATGLRAGDIITLTGKNMELITNITFPGVADAVAPASQSETEVTVAMPAAAITGEIQLNTGSGVSVPVAIETLKPLFSGFAAAELSLGTDVTILGENLDLVTKVVYTGGAEVAVTNSNAAELTIIMPTTGSETGKLTLFMGNGESVETEVLTINAPEFCYIPVMPGEDAELKGGEVFQIEVANGDKLTGVTVNGQNVQYIINGDKNLFINMPQTAGKGTKIMLISSNGSIEYSIDFIPATDIKTPVWTGLVTLGWGDGGRVLIPASAFEGVPAGARMVLHYTQPDQVWAQAQINYGDWSGIAFTEGDVKIESGNTLVPTDVYGWEFSSRSTPLVLTQEILDNIQAKKGECEGVLAGVIIQGSDLVFNKVTIEYEISLETTIWSGEWTCSGWAGNQDLAWGGYDWSTFKAGQKIYFTVGFTDPTAGWACLSARVGDGWANLSVGQFDLTPGTEDYKIEYTPTEQDVIDLQTKNGLVITGDGFILKKVSIL